jgi:hypothetical protein
MSADDLLHRLLTGFAIALAPLEEAASSPDALAQFVGGFGWTLTAADSSRVNGSLSGISVPSDPSALTTEQLVTEIVAVAGAVRGIASSGAPTAFVSTFPGDVLDYLIHSALAANGPKLFALLHLFGVLTEKHVPADSATGRDDHIAREVHWDRLSMLGSQPADALRQAYGWGGDFRGDEVLRSIGLVIQAFGGHAGMFAADRDLVDEYWAPGSAPPSGISNLIVSLPQFSADVFGDGSSVTTSVALLGIPIPPSASAPAPADGLALMPVVTGQAGDTIAITDHVTLTLSGDVLSRPVRAELHPGASVLRATPGDTHVTALARVDAKAAPATPWLAFGDATSTRLEVASAHVSLSLDGTLDGDLELVAEVGLDAAVLVIDLGGSGSFVGDTLGSQPIRAPVALVLHWSSRAGLSLVGQPRLAISIPVGRTIGPITVSAIGVGLGSDAGAATFDATVTASGMLGPFTVTVAEAGLRVRVEPVPDGAPPGNLGVADAGIGLKPPSGAGLAITAPGLSGGGFIGRDPATGRYSGGLNLKAQQIDITGLGLLDTKLPGGQRGYALLIALGATFPGIEIGLGFALTGVGGLIALNRRVDVDVLRNRLASGTAGRILAPQDPIRNAPALLADLDAVFPIAPGITVVGPTVQLVWADLVHFDIGVFIELPGPARVVLLGSAHAEIQRDSRTLLSIRVDVAGVVDLHAETAAFDAVLIDSHLLGILDLTGGAAFRLSWGDQPYSVFTVGGFNPSYNPEPLSFPASLTRIAMVHGTPKDEVYLRFEGYLAVTSNTLQFGASVDALIQSGGFVVHGTIGFDALIQFVPFHFQFDIRASVDVSYGSHHLAGLTLTGSLTGPGPVVLQAKVCIEILFFDICFSHTFELGAAATAPSPVAPDLLDTLLAELTDPARLRGDGTPDPFVLVRPPEPGNGVPVILPVGGLIWDQNRAPLDLLLDRISGTPLPAPAQVQAQATNAASGPATDWFAPGQFVDLTDDQALTRPAYERLTSGVHVAGTAYADGPSAVRVLQIREIRLPAGAEHQRPFPAFPPWLVGGAVSVSQPVISVTTEAWTLAASGGDQPGLTGAQARRLADLTGDGHAIPATDHLAAFAF